MSGKISKIVSLFVVAAVIAGCGRINSAGSSANPFKRDRTAQAKVEEARDEDGNIIRQRANDVIVRNQKEQLEAAGDGIDLASLLRPPKDDRDIRVNKHIWTAALETLSFLPVEAADPFSGILVLGWGSAPGSNTQFRGTVLIQDPALEAGSLKVALQKRNGPASAETNKRIEDAILTRARQLRIAQLRR